MLDFMVKFILNEIEDRSFISQNKKERLLKMADIMKEIRDLLKKVFERINDESLSPYELLYVLKQLLNTVIVNIDPGWSWKRMQGACKFGNTAINPEFTEANLPPLGFVIEKNITVELREQDRASKSSEWANELLVKQGTYRFAHPLVVLAICRDYPLKQRQSPIFTMWLDPEGLIWFLIITEYDSKLSLIIDTDPWDHDREWSRFHRPAICSTLPIDGRV